MKRPLRLILTVCLAAALIFAAVRILPHKGNDDPTTAPAADSSAELTTAAVSVSSSAPITEAMPETSPPLPETSEAASVPESSAAGTTSSVPAATTGNPRAEEHPAAPELDYVKNLSVPAYSGEPYIILNDNLPFFDTDELTPEAYEIYYDLDSLGRCTLADAVIGRELMPTEKRGSISSVKPTGWHTDRYPQELVDGQALYNRCHMIAFGLAGEEANPYNLVTGTRYFNTKGVNDFENMTIDYIRETGNHVRYRCTPVFSGENLVCDGQILEAWSIEDDGEGICFNIYSYNVQPGIHIDYATGDNWLENGERPTEPETTTAELPTLAEDREGTFILNTKKKTFHRPECDGAVSMSEKNRQEYTGSYNQLILDGYLPCGSCEP